MSSWLIKLAVLLLAVSVFREATDAQQWMRQLSFPGFTGKGPTEVSPETAKAIGVLVWAFGALFVAWMLSELRATQPTMYSVLILVGSALIIGYFAVHLQDALTGEQLAGFGGGSIGAIDGFVVFRSRRGRSNTANE